MSNVTGERRGTSTSVRKMAAWHDNVLLASHWSPSLAALAQEACANPPAHYKYPYQCYFWLLNKNNNGEKQLAWPGVPLLPNSVSYRTGLRNARELSGVESWQRDLRQTGGEGPLQFLHSKYLPFSCHKLHIKSIQASLTRQDSESPPPPDNTLTHTHASHCINKLYAHLSLPSPPPNLTLTSYRPSQGLTRAIWTGSPCIGGGVLIN